MSLLDRHLTPEEKEAKQKRRREAAERAILLEERRRAALDTLRRNPLRPGPWVTPVEFQDWPRQLSVASGSANALRSFGAREAFRFRAACSTCRDSIDVDRYWRTILLLTSRRALESEPPKCRPTVEEWVTAYEVVMNVCVRDLQVELRLELPGVRAEIAEEYNASDFLRFGATHIGRYGVVSSLHLGFSDDTTAIGSIADAPESCDWSEAPRNFKNVLLEATSLRAVMRHGDKKITLVHVIRQGFEGMEQWPEAYIDAMGGATLTTHSVYPNYCCEFALHWKLQVPTATFAHFLCPHLDPIIQHQASLVLRAPPSIPKRACGTCFQLPITLVGDLWNHRCCESYAKYFEDGTDSSCPDRGYYESLAVRFQTTLDPLPTTQLCKDTIECRSLYLHNAEILESPCLRFDMPLNASGKFTRYELPDRVSLWALDGYGRTCFQLHGLTLGWMKGPDQMVDSSLARLSSCSRALAREGVLALQVDVSTERLSLVIPRDGDAHMVMGQLLSGDELYSGSADELRNRLNTLLDAAASGGHESSELLNMLRNVLAQGREFPDGEEDEESWDEESEEEEEEEADVDEEGHGE